MVYDWRTAYGQRNESRSNTGETREAPLRDDVGAVELPFQDGDGEAVSDSVQQEDYEGEQEMYSRNPGERFTVKEITEHEDGSATYQIEGSKEDMQTLFEAFFLQALTSGIESAREKTERFVAEHNALKAADKLVRFLDVWEEAECLDYDPSVKKAKEDLKNLLKKVEV